MVWDNLTSCHTTCVTLQGVTPDSAAADFALKLPDSSNAYATVHVCISHSGQGAAFSISKAAYSLYTQIAKTAVRRNRASVSTLYRQPNNASRTTLAQLGRPTCHLWLPQHCNGFLSI